MATMQDIREVVVLEWLKQKVAHQLDECIIQGKIPSSECTQKLIDTVADNTLDHIVKNCIGDVVDLHLDLKAINL